MLQIKPEERATLCLALETFGPEAQEQMAIGEIGEFLTLFGRRSQGRMMIRDMQDEIADVLVMLHQMALIYGEDEVLKRISYKIERLEGRIAAHKLRHG